MNWSENLELKSFLVYFSW